MDDYGRYTLEEMREAVRRRLDLLRKVVSVTTGEEGATLQKDPLVSNEDLNQYLNTALVKRNIDISVLDPTIMGDEEKIDIVTGQVEYQLPADMLFLRGLYFKPLGTTYTDSPPVPRIYLYEYDQEGDINDELLGVPSYRRRLNFIVLNQVPQEDNAGGLIVDYVKGALPLREDDQVLETPLATIMQEVIILDAAIYITSERMRIPATELRLSQKELEQRLTLAAVNYHTPKTIQMASTVPMAYAPVGRRNRSWSGRFGYRYWR